MDQAKPQQNHQYDDDSSEDEIPVPMKLSALTKALLKDEAPQNGAQPAQTRQPSPPRTRRQASALNAAGQAPATRRSTRSSRASEERSVLPESPSREQSPAARKRVVRLSNTPQSLSQMAPGKRRSASSSQLSYRHTPQSNNVERYVDENEPHDPQADLSTPAQPARVVRVTSASSVNRSRLESAGNSSGRSHHERSAMDRSVMDKSAVEPDYDQSEAPDTAARNAAHVGTGSISRYPSTRSRNDDNGNPQSSMRVKRVGKLPGSFLSGPARRGRRQQSEEGVEGNGDVEQGAHEPASIRRDDEAGSPRYQNDGIGGFNSGSPVGGSAARASHRRNNSGIDVRVDSAKTSPRESRQEPKREAEEESNIGDIGHLVSVGRLQLPSGQDQENENPLNRKWAKPIVSDLDKARRPLHADVAPAREASPDRKPLASIGQNTPHRAAPPPPKMSSVLDAATASTGPAATTQTKQRRNILKVNGKCYTRLDCLGRGGCGKVYRVTGENGQMFALKRIMLENADPSMIKGFHLEIQLMEKLRDAERVVNLFAHELNSEKQILSLVMEMGERDLDRIMFNHQKTDNQKLDTVFIRYWWKEMLECVRSVHQYDIVHSDLKPANFVLVQGQLKLIDFGIANAIQTDETVNVHRDNHVGTPNYMSPESLMDSNNPRGARMAGQPKLMRVGKPSDVWSLGCILYRMVYGVLPFGHMINHLARCQAIINWDHRIEFPTRATGGALVPPSLIRTMKRCLTRDAHLRPTCEELLHESDPFLYPVEFSERALPIDEELLGRIIQSVVTRCRERMPTDGETSNVWPQAYWASIRKSMAGRM